MTNFDTIQLAILVLLAVAVIGGQFSNFILFRHFQRDQRQERFERYDDKNAFNYRRYGFYGHSQFESQLRDYLLVYIAQTELSRGVRLTNAAREILIIPVLEAAHDNTERKFDLQEAQRSIDEIITAIAEGGSRRPDRPQDSKSVVRAFWKRFCNIPPFCDGEGPVRQ